MRRKKREKQPVPLSGALVTMAALAAVMMTGILRYKVSPHIPMLAGCAVAAAVAALWGHSWRDIEGGMIAGIDRALSSMMILLLIGVLMGIWIQAGVVPAMVYYGLGILTPRYFLATAMLLCALVSMALNSWGTIGTVGLALMGISGALGVPAPVAAGAIVSGAYLGDKISPFSDTCNLASAVTGVDIFQNITRNLWLPFLAVGLAGAGFLAAGLQYQGEAGGLAAVEELSAGLRQTFVITPLALLPVAALVGCVLCRVPSVPSIAIGIFTAFFQGLWMQRTTMGELLAAGMSGYQGTGGVSPGVDALLMTGGLESMMNSLSMILCAMMFGGVMECTGQIDALMKPLLRRVRGFGGLVAATVASCVGVNLLLPEQYISIAVPGGLFRQEYDRHGVPRQELAFTLGAGGSCTSALVPWNTCGVFISGVLGVTAMEYLPFAFYNLLLPLLTLLWAALAGRRHPFRLPEPSLSPFSPTDEPAAQRPPVV